MCIKYIYIYIYIYIYNIYKWNIYRWNPISTVTWQTVHEHIVAEKFCSNKSSSVLLVHKQQAPQKRCLSSCHSTACGDCKRSIYMATQAVCAKRLNFGR